MDDAAARGPVSGRVIGLPDGISAIARITIPDRHFGDRGSVGRHSAAWDMAVRDGAPRWADRWFRSPVQIVPRPALGFGSFGFRTGGNCQSGALPCGEPVNQMLGSEPLAVELACGVVGVHAARSAAARGPPRGSADRLAPVNLVTKMPRARLPSTPD